MNKLVVFLFTYILCLLPTFLQAQNNNKVFYTLETANQKTRRCFSVTQTQDGFIWYVTEDGISRFDGTYTKSYPILIRWRGMLKVNSKGELFMITSDGFGYKYNQSKDRFDPLFMVAKPHQTYNSEQLPENLPLAFDKVISSQVSSASIDTYDRIWLGTGKGPVCFNPETKKWLYIKGKGVENSFLEIQNNQLYLFTSNGVFYLDIKAKLTNKTAIKKLNNSTVGTEITAVVFENETGNIYMGTSNKGLFCYTKEGELKYLMNLSSSVIRSLKVYDQNTLLVGFDGLGIYEYDIFSEKISNHYLVDENKSGSLKSNAVYELFIDSEKRIWVANYTTGIEVHDPSMVSFSRFNHLLNNNNSLCHNNVLSIAEDRSGNLWFGTYNGLSIYKKTRNSWSHFLVNNLSTQTNSYINTLCLDANGNIWAGGVFGLIQFNSQNFAPQKVDFQNVLNKSENKDILTLFPDNNNSTVWAAGLHTDLIQIDLQTKKINNYKPQYLRGIDREDNNHLLLLTDNRIISFNKVTQTTSFLIDSIIKKQTGIHDPLFLAMRQKDNNIWLATKSSGLIQYSKSTNTTFVYNKENGLPDNRVLSIEIDNNDFVWIATDEGLCYLNPITKIIIPFKVFNDSEKGLFNINASVKLNDGNIVFGTKEGAIQFDPREMFVTHKRGKLALTDFIILNKNNKSRTFQEISHIPLNKTEKIVLKYFENSFTIKFEELIYGHTIKPRYSYRLKGYETTFSPLSQQGSATYYSIPPGKYTLEIQAYYADKEGKPVLRNVKLVISRPWYNTLWAWIIWLAIIVIIVLAIYRYFKHRLEIRYSNEKISFFINVSHDMRTPITLIKAPLGDLLQDKSLSPSALFLVQMINNNVNRLFHMINRVLDFEKADEQEMKLQIEEHDLNKYLIGITENYISYAEANALTIQAEVGKVPLWVTFDKEKMDMILENLISNAIKYSKHGGHVKVIAGNDETKWWIEVIDNGIGIPSKEQKQIFKRFYRAENAVNSKKIGSGMGLLLVHNLTLFMGGKVSFESEEGKQTIFRVTIPFAKTDTPVDLHLLNNQESEIKSSEQPTVENQIPTLLFVDDNNEIREYISGRLSEDYKVITAESATDAWRILQNEKVDIMITDIMMPKISGIELCEKIKSNVSFAHIPIVLLSALSDKKDILKGLQIGADDYITKPFDSILLKQRIDNILENRNRLAQYLFSHKGELLQLERQYFVGEMDKLFLEKLGRTFNLNIANPEYTIDSLCADLGMSRSVFYNKLKNLTNLSPNDYLRIQRMEKAAELLLSHEYAVYEVAEMVGYSDVKHFTSLFKKRFGCAPGQFVKK